LAVNCYGGSDTNNDFKKADLVLIPEKFGSAAKLILNPDFPDAVVQEK